MSPYFAAGEPVTIQYGFTEPDESLPGVTWVKFFEHAEMVQAILESDAFICHAGVGSVITSLTNDVTPIVIARERRFGEHVDDHQVDLARRLAERGLVVDLPHGDEDVQAAARRASDIRVDARVRGRRLFEAIRATIPRPAGAAAGVLTPEKH